MPLAPLGQRHRERLADSRRDTVRIVRIDQQRRFAFLSRSSETRQDKHSWVVGILRCNIFFGDEVHSVTQWGHEPNARGAIKPGKRRVTIGTVDITNRRPVCLTLGAVDAPRGRPNLLLHIGILRYLGAALGCDLQVSYLAPPVRLRLEEQLECRKPMRDPF